VAEHQCPAAVLRLIDGVRRQTLWQHAGRCLGLRGIVIAPLDGCDRAFDEKLRRAFELLLAHGVFGRTVILAGRLTRDSPSPTARAKRANRTLSHV